MILIIYSYLYFIKHCNIFAYLFIVYIEPKLHGVRRNVLKIDRNSVRYKNSCQENVFVKIRCTLYATSV